MTINEMIPDRTDPARDPRFWCLPPVHDSPNDTSGRFPMYLVAQGRQVGVWHNWRVVKAMVSGHSSGAQRGHWAMAGCVAEWQEHCLLSMHPHPADPACADKPCPLSLVPATTSTSPISHKAALGPPEARQVDPAVCAAL
ncbi:hypothetical protein B0H14DRAFT_2622306 [Mycena olivaceomarginata]|nr:hypothetical protein B0H14DRAFT_2622306 [Mycena olivaceomarginata]